MKTVLFVTLAVLSVSFVECYPSRRSPCGPGAADLENVLVALRDELVRDYDDLSGVISLAVSNTPESPENLIDDMQIKMVACMVSNIKSIDDIASLLQMPASAQPILRAVYPYLAKAAPHISGIERDVASILDIVERMGLFNLPNSASGGAAPGGCGPEAGELGNALVDLQNKITENYSDLKVFYAWVMGYHYLDIDYLSDEPPMHFDSMMIMQMACFISNIRSVDDLVMALPRNPNVLDLHIYRNPNFLDTDFIRFVYPLLSQAAPHVSEILRKEADVLDVLEKIGMFDLE